MSTILDEVGGSEDINFDNDDDEYNEEISEVDDISLDELNSQLSEAIENEDYELASRLRDEINKRG